MSIKLFVKKQLAEDIENLGGLNLFINQDPTDQSLSKLLDQNKNLYGERGTPIRAKLRNLVKRWSAYKPSEYQKKVLEKFGVVHHLKRFETESDAKQTPVKKVSVCVLAFEVKSVFCVLLCSASQTRFASQSRRNSTEKLQIEIESDKKELTPVKKVRLRFREIPSERFFVLLRFATFRINSFHHFHYQTCNHQQCLYTHLESTTTLLLI